MHPKIIVVLGPTASGKSDLVVTLAKKFNGEIVSADSRQVYRGMTIGTAKPTKKEMAGVKHYLIDIKNPDQPYTLAEYQSDAVAVIWKIISEGKLPILAGGTALYIKAVVENLKIPEVRPNPPLRRKIEKKIKEEGLSKVFAELLALDPEAAYIVDRQNPRRVIRALEVALSTKKPFSAQRWKGPVFFDAFKIGIFKSPEKLRSDIDRRADQMLKAGLVKEVRKMVKIYGTKTTALDAIGYREIICFLKGKSNLEEAADLIKKNTWNFARRQMTWWRNDDKIHWIKTEKQAEKIVRWFLKNRIA
jgi:tRNA dimethylallyltransferase